MVIRNTLTPVRDRLPKAAVRYLRCLISNGLNPVRNRRRSLRLISNGVKLTEARKEIIFRTEFPQEAFLGFKATGISLPPRIISLSKKTKV